MSVYICIMCRYTEGPIVQMPKHPSLPSKVALITFLSSNIQHQFSLTPGCTIESIHCHFLCTHLCPFKVEHHPKMTRYAAENFSLREENHQLRSLESVVNAQEAAAQVAAELEEAFQRAMETEKLTESTIISSSIRKG